MKTTKQEERRGVFATRLVEAARRKGYFYVSELAEATGIPIRRMNRWMNKGISYVPDGKKNPDLVRVCKLLEVSYESLFEDRNVLWTEHKYNRMVSHIKGMAGLLGMTANSQMKSEPEDPQRIEARKKIESAVNARLIDDVDARRLNALLEDILFDATPFASSPDATLDKALRKWVVKVRKLRDEPNEDDVE